MIMATVTIPKKEYVRLKRKASAYQKIVGSFFQSVVRDPIEDVVTDFRKTAIYTDEFLKDLGNGLRKSSWGKRR